VIRSVSNWREEIFAYFDVQLTNAYTESFNALARKMNRAGNGY
jgi:transposase